MSHIKKGFVGTGSLRPGKNRPGPHTIEHPENNPWTGKPQQSMKPTLGGKK
jgi:hypothetical protein